MSSTIPTPRAKNVDYYIPQPEFPVSLAVTDDASKLPKLFQTLKIKGLTLPNRIGVSPMATYSGDDNFEVTPFHLIHYGALASAGAGLIIVESSTVSKEGAGSLHDLGIWTDAQAVKLKAIVDYAHVQKQVIGIQLAHDGRKASGRPLFEHLEDVVPESEGGWPDDVVAPSAIQHRPFGNFRVPKELTNAEVKEIVKKFGEAAKRAIDIAGFDFVEIHAAHGYLLNEFLSETSNERTDEYGGSFENRIRFVVEIADEIRANIPKTVPVFIRISATEGVDEPTAWTIEDSIKFAEVIIDHGVDVIDVSSSGVNYKQGSRSSARKLRHEGIPHEHLASALKKALGDRVLIACVGGLGNNSKITNSLLEEGAFDIALVGRTFLTNPALTSQFAKELGVEIHQAIPYGWVAHPKVEGILELIERTQRLSVKAN